MARTARTARTETLVQWVQPARGEWPARQVQWASRVQLVQQGLRVPEDFKALLGRRETKEIRAHQVLRERLVLEENAASLVLRERRANAANLERSGLRVNPAVSANQVRREIKALRAYPAQPAYLAIAARRVTQEKMATLDRLERSGLKALLAQPGREGNQVPLDPPALPARMAGMVPRASSDRSRRSPMAQSSTRGT